MASLQITSTRNETLAFDTQSNGIATKRGGLKVLVCLLAEEEAAEKEEERDGGSNSALGDDVGGGQCTPQHNPGVGEQQSEPTEENEKDEWGCGGGEVGEPVQNGGEDE